MSEVLTLTTPISVTTYAVNELQMNRKLRFINVEVENNRGDIIRASWGGLIAYNLILALNKANLSAGNSLEKRILQQLVTDGYLPPGSVTGSPD